METNLQLRKIWFNFGTERGICLQSKLSGDDENLKWIPQMYAVSY